MYPEIQSVEPASGTLAGGTLLNITGRGFPDADWVDMGQPGATARQGAATVYISVAGVACRVVSSSYSQLQCVTGAAPGSVMPTQSPIRGMYPGHRGILYDWMPVV